MYHPGCGIYYVNLEACGGDQSPGGAASTVRLVQLGYQSPGGAAITERLLQLRFVVKGVQEPTNESVPEPVEVRNIYLSSIV